MAAYARRVPRAATTLPGAPASVPAARRWAVATLAGWGLPETGWVAAQVVSELATNATLHARTGFTVVLDAEDGCVRIETSDTSPTPLRPRTHSTTATTGRGLGIVAALASDWGVRADEPGKTVWVLLAVEDADLAD